ncbi:MAG TPA: DNA-protecting protein DprA, partial [Cytophagales bacterium]|nr:DNA-protecting protein DprA [Cytophagales bacterium]
MNVSPERLAFLALHFVPGIGNFLVKQLVSYCGSAEAVFQSAKGKLVKIPNVGEITAQAIKTGAPLREAEEEFEKATKEGAEILFYTDDKYPSRLREIDDAPSVIYWKGQANLNHAKIVALVGTRQATAYGRKVTERLVEELKPHQALVISGL